MAITIVRSRATVQQMTAMLEALEGYIKLAVDVERGILAGGGAMHADCESALLDDGSVQEDVWVQIGIHRRNKSLLNRLLTFAHDKAIVHLK
jgi:hypothetical protein